MIRYHFDLYPRDDPRDGARVVRFTKLQSAEYRGEANGTGSGRFSIRADVAEAQNIDPRGLQYVRVVQENTVGPTESVVGGFFLDSGDFSALDEKGTRLLTFGGAGTLSYTARAVMAPHTYLANHPSVFIASDPRSDTWNLYEQGTAPSVGDYLGAVAWRVVWEAQAFRSGAYQHIHADGTAATDTHADDRLVSAIPDLVLDFDGYEDSNGNAWTQASGEFKAQVGENLLQVLKRLMEAGLYVSMDPDTFELSAYQADTHRRDRTGAAWGASVIRFQAPTDGTTATGNIKSDALRAIAAFVKRSTIWVGGQDSYAKASGTTDIPWEGGYYSDAEDLTALAQIGSTQVDARDDAGDTLRLRFTSDQSAPATGRYLPFVDILLDDLVTVHTGTGQWDFDEQTFPVAALTLSLRSGGDWDCWVDLGSSYGSAQTRQFQVSPVPAHSHRPNPPLCPFTVGDPIFVTAANNSEGALGAGSLAVPAGLTDAAIFIAVGHMLGQTIPPTASWNGVAATRLGSVNHPTQGGISLFVILNPAPGDAMLESSNGNGHLGAWLYENVNQASPLAGSVFATGASAAAAAALTEVSGALPIAAMAVDDDDFTLDASISPPVAGVGLTSDWATADQLGTPGYRDIQYAGGHGDWSAGWTLDASHPWSAFVAAVRGAGSSGAGSIEIVGTNGHAARCDHNHYVESLLTQETDDSLVLAPDGVGGLEFRASEAGGATDHGSLTGLADDDHPQYATNAEFDDHSARHEPGGADSMTVDAAAGVGSLRTLGTGATQAAAGPHTHAVTVYEPLTNGDAATPELIFMDGDVVMVPM